MSTNAQNSENEHERKDRLSIEWRRSKVLKYSSMGYDQREIAKFLQIHESTISRDIECLRQESRQALQEYISKKLPDEIRKSFIAMDTVSAL
jgi:transposase